MDNNNNNKFLEIKVTDDSYQGQKREIICKKQNIFLLNSFTASSFMAKLESILLHCER